MAEETGNKPIDADSKMTEVTAENGHQPFDADSKMVEDTGKEQPEELMDADAKMSEETTGNGQPEELFQPIDADSNEVTEIESYCVNCSEQGTTKLMLTKIPFFRDVIVSSFDCSHCGFRNSELNSGLEIAPMGIEYVLVVNDPMDLNRMVVKGDAASVQVPELELEIPAHSQKGEVTTVEGILSRVMHGLRQDQPRRKDAYPEDYQQIEVVLERIEDCLSLHSPFTVVVRDISGNSFVGNRPDKMNIEGDTNLQIKKFARSKEEDQMLGIGVEECPAIEEEPEVNESEQKNFKEEVLKMATNCPECGASCFTKMKVTDIPLFKEVIIMATDCDKCGARTNEVKSGGGVEAKGKRIKLKVKSKDDFSRDVLKSDTCHVEIPELELQAGSGAIVGKFTTIEGLLMDIKKQLSDDNPLVGGDSVDPSLKGKMEKFCEELSRLLTGDHEFTIILDDPAGNCYIQNVYAPDEDPEMVIEEYERTFEQNEELGLNDMNVGDEQIAQNEEPGLNDQNVGDGQSAQNEEQGVNDMIVGDDQSAP